jgi:hypothetical protein
MSSFTVSDGIKQYNVVITEKIYPPPPPSLKEEHAVNTMIQELGTNMSKLTEDNRRKIAEFKKKREEHQNQKVILNDTNGIIKTQTDSFGGRKSKRNQKKSKKVKNTKRRRTAKSS